MSTFEKRLKSLINEESMENGSDTPDFILAAYLRGCLDNFDAAMRARTRWYTANPSTTEPPQTKGP